MTVISVHTKDCEKQEEHKKSSTNQEIDLSEENQLSKDSEEYVESQIDHTILQIDQVDTDNTPVKKKSEELSTEDMFDETIRNNYEFIYKRKKRFEKNEICKNFLYSTIKNVCFISFIVFSSFGFVYSVYELVNYLQNDSTDIIYTELTNSTLNPLTVFS
ncbi:hypothetical protein AB837_00473 [bacterium AB1]|nr:hypothetical protein AB837_00473 [bacterium AB1]